jgi:hypothetical protein
LVDTHDSRWGVKDDLSRATNLYAINLSVPLPQRGGIQLGNDFLAIGQTDRYVRGSPDTN